MPGRCPESITHNRPDLICENNVFILKQDCMRVQVDLLEIGGACLLRAMLSSLLYIKSKGTKLMKIIIFLHLEKMIFFTF